MPDNEDVRLPEEAIPPIAPQFEVVPEPEVKPEEEEEDELADLFTPPEPEDNDMTTDHLVKAPEKEDLSDLFEVSDEDIMGEAPAPEPEPPPKPRYRIVRRPIRRSPPPPTIVGGIR